MHYHEIIRALTAMLSVRVTTLININPLKREALIKKMEEGFRSMDECGYKISKTTETLEGKAFLWPMMTRFCEVWEASPDGVVKTEDLESQ